MSKVFMGITNKTLLPLILMLIVSLTSTVISAQSDEKISGSGERILILGSARGELFDIEDRILREEVIRLLVKSGREIVTVMEIEKEYRENALDPRTTNPADIAIFASHLKAKWVAHGNFSKKTELFKYTLLLQNIPTGRQYRTEIPLDNRGAPGEYWQKLAGQITDAIVKITTENR